jgi:hypothetical protein
LFTVTESWTTVESVFFGVGIATLAVLLIIAVVAIVKRRRGQRQYEPQLQAHVLLSPMLTGDSTDTVTLLLAHQQQPQGFGLASSVADTQTRFGENVSNMVAGRPQALYAQIKPNKQKNINDKIGC